MFSPHMGNISFQSTSFKINTENVIPLQQRFTHKKARGDLKPVPHSQGCYKLYIWQLAFKNHRKTVDLGKKEVISRYKKFTKRLMLRLIGNF